MKTYLAFVMLLLSSLSYAGKANDKECNGWHELKWGSSLEQTQAEAKKHLGARVVLEKDSDSNNECVESYSYVSPDNKKYDFCFFKKRLWLVRICYKGYLDDGNLPQLLIDSLTQKYSRSGKFEAGFDNKRDLLMECISKWDDQPAKVIIEARTCTVSPVWDYTYTVQFEVDKISGRRIYDLEIECETGREYHTPKSTWELNKRDFKKDF